MLLTLKKDMSMRLLLLLLTLLFFTSCYNETVSPETSEKPETNSLTIYSGENGVVVPSGTIEVELDSSITLKATADENYQFEKWIQVGIDELKELDSLSSKITLSELSSSAIALKASFVPKNCTLVVIPSDSARTISPDDTVIVPYGSKVSVATKAKEGYAFDRWKLSDVNYVSVSNLVDEALVVTLFGNGSIQPLFRQESTELELCTLVVISSDSAYSMTPEDTVIVPYGNKVSLSTKARVGYVFDRWNLSDVNALFVSSLMEESVVVTMLGSGTISPLFRSLNHTVTIDSVENGTINQTGIFTMSEQDSLEIIATPNEHYRFVQWKQVGETTVPIDDITSPKTFIRGVVGSGAIEPIFERRIITAFHSAPFLATSGGSTLLIDLFDEEGNGLRIEEGDILEINIKDATTTYDPVEIEVGNFKGTADKVSTVEELLSAIRYALLDKVVGPGLPNVEVSLTPDGRMNIAIGNEQIASLNVGNKTRPTSDTYTKNLFNWSGSNFTGMVNYSRGSLLRPARETDYIIETYNSQGRPSGLEGGDEVTTSGEFDGKYLTTPATNFVISDDWNEPKQPMKDLIDRIQSRLDDAMGHYFKVTINQDNPNFPKGAILIIPSEVNLFTFSDFEVSANNSNNNSIAPSAFNQTMEFTYIYDDEE